MTLPRVCILGAGAIGGYLGARLALAGTAEVSLVARGPHLEALRTHGLTLIEGDRHHTVRVPATDTPADLGPQDYVIVTLKANAVPDAVPLLQALLGPETCVVMGVNGVPWWYFHRCPGPWEDHRLASVDPGDAQWTGIGPDRVLGCVVHPAAEVEAPGVVRHIEGTRFSLGEPSGDRSRRALVLAAALSAAGLKAPVRSDIRTEIWVKLWGNLCFNPLSALTGAPLDALCADPGTRGVARAMMLEAQAVAESLGIHVPIDVDRRIAGAAAVGAHKTSMLQDLERGRPMEIEALVGAVAELGRLVGAATPTLDTVLALVRLRAQLAGCLEA
ncbi:2-dehydropantoate 2-reductase [Roseospira visakhapatnamensis]|uniref:2-dehydropantoate 2-reductase n=1 Tax=Roseospira visakhapatnamensis TaxID=390880 RepID=A0A7W6WAZ5_9PROT|nr:2-dehydropantoate 2-reductase [Roseospira visakhapatnamensis]MBB4267006.1 2-dehydropantoate 2-reductase [Roseospira visakhapatnamensis]